ncbi:uncharacterized protein LOC106011918 [Aplysia californica]|uniref:Uncharacterized protein LOC106011918 n=1 Tax=Aplysia californica TaxID=6500 RepID=A0ABM1A0Y3_APLCA|nr:uncharacterized protein LOC106011918 [Aplysia californica]
MVMRRGKNGPEPMMKPDAILFYYRYMFGVDLSDQLRSYYAVGRKSVKWWRYVLWFVVQMSLANASILFKAANRPLPGNQHPFSQLRFRLSYRRLSLATSAGEANHSTAGLGSSLSSDHQISRMHGREAVCYEGSRNKVKTPKGRPPETCYGCLICKSRLCKGKCFASLHQRLAKLQS